MPLIPLTTTNAPPGGYRILSPYTDDDTTFANKTLCPRYAECDPTSAPPSPASVESLDMLDSTPWRRDYISLSSHRRASGNTLRARWKGNKLYATMMMVCLLLILAAAGSALAMYLSGRVEKSK
ncbi:hypothetical protein ACJQWK_10594 [Exserohilum turcicum]|uniref:Uncharacterized protein n=1 Tax=Exserohilum turcicum (strain 28A) TaxID=671987 RepID=R0I7S4_EXST2|nr:uncharacterized protein SETTUDRAFT_181765 [Exserohilum turcica Et28A]EOA81595.1 hypothetical protein SETTUDRAFT_181765 [Exserohilum turcica Et28A]